MSNTIPTWAFSKAQKDIWIEFNGNTLALIQEIERVRNLCRAELDKALKNERSI